MKRLSSLMRTLATLAFISVGWHNAAHSQDFNAALGRDWIAIDLSQLDEMRGGFVTPTGMRLSFGIERVAFVNGQLVASMSINIPDVGRMTAEQAQALASLNDTVLIQIGPGNTFQSSGRDGIVIQNTLDGQHIRTHTTIDVGTSTLGLYQDINTFTALQSALINAPGGP